MDANSDEPRSELDIADLTHSLAYGNKIHDCRRGEPAVQGRG